MLKLYKNIDRFRMLIMVSDCHPKTPKQKNKETKHILRRIVINTITRDRSDVDRTGGQVRCFFKSQVNSDLTCPSLQTNDQWKICERFNVVQQI